MARSVGSAGKKKLVKKTRRGGHKKRSKRQALKSVKEHSVKALESEILGAGDFQDEQDEPEASLAIIDEPESKNKISHTRDMLEQIMFRLPCVPDPLIGTPQQVKTELDALEIGRAHV